MKSKELRNEFLGYFEKRGHEIVPSSSLIPEDNTVLLTTAGMQQFKPYYLEEKSPYGKKVASIQKCFRTSDIEEVGDERHLTFFEMLGNFSFGGYFKKEAIELAKEFIDSLRIKIDYVTVFEGHGDTPKDKESIEIWNGLSFSEEKGNLKLCNKEENFWGPTGKEGPCGPTTEIYAGGVEIWNIVFNEYYSKNGKLEKLKTLGIDTGMGLERLAMVMQKKETLFETDLFYPLIQELEKISGKKYKDNKKKFRIIADHIRGACFLIADGVLPGKEEREYIPRRLLRETVECGRQLGLPKNFISVLAIKIIKQYKNIYLELNQNIVSIIEREIENFEKNLGPGISDTVSDIGAAGGLTGEIAVNAYQSRGIPLERAKELARDKGFKISENIDVYFEKALKKHQEISRAGVEKKFKGGLADHGEQTTRYHTATHLLLAALKRVLNKEVEQRGSNINSERLRFDFSYDIKLSNEEIQKVENLVNEKIKKGIEVKCEEMSLEQARKEGATGIFREKYGEIVKVYTIGDFSKEICGGPHAKNTSELGKFKITKEESSGISTRRIKAILK